MKNWIFLCAFIIVSLLTLWQGEAPWPQVYQGALERISGLSNDWNPLLDERLPRLIIIFCSGASLAVSGAVMQSLFRNPLASPSILGISSGGSLCVIAMFIFGWHQNYPFTIPLAAFTGCLATLLLVYLLSYRNSAVELNTLIFTGIAISSVLIAIQSALLYSLRDNWHLIQTLTEWEAGSTTDRSWTQAHMQLPLTLVGLFGCIYYRREMDILTLGEEEAKNLGVDVEKVRWRLFLCISLLTGGVLAAVGVVAFFGLLLPHLIRKIQGPGHMNLIPSAIILGSLTFAGIDLILRLMSIQKISIGNISAILGGIFFLLLFLGNQQQRRIAL